MYMYDLDMGRVKIICKDKVIFGDSFAYDELIVKLMNVIYYKDNKTYFKKELLILRDDIKDIFFLEKSVDMI